MEERELTVLIVMDVSASGAFGTIYESKREKMAECAALLAFSAVRNHDKVGLLLYSDRTELYLPPRSGKTHALRLIREMMACEPCGTGTDHEDVTVFHSLHPPVIFRFPSCTGCPGTGPCRSLPGA